jgi:hypothetical protein
MSMEMHLPHCILQYHHVAVEINCGLLRRIYKQFGGGILHEGYLPYIRKPMNQHIPQCCRSLCCILGTAFHPDNPCYTERNANG